LERGDGDHLKIHSRAFEQMKSNFCSMKNIFYDTLEYIVVEGLQGDVCGEFISCSKIIHALCILIVTRLMLRAGMMGNWWEHSSEDYT
jgi:hypothetical protein